MSYLIKHVYKKKSCLDMYTRTHKQKCIYIYIYIYVCVCVSVCVCIYIYMCMCVCVLDFIEERRKRLKVKRSCYVLTFDPAQRNAIPRWCTGRKWHIPMASNRKRSRGRIKAYNMGQGEGPHCANTDWCTGREWPLNFMTIISAWWRLNIRFQRSSGWSCGRWIII